MASAGYEMCRTKSTVSVVQNQGKDFLPSTVPLSTCHSFLCYLIYCMFLQRWEYARSKCSWRCVSAQTCTPVPMCLLAVAGRGWRRCWELVLGVCGEVVGSQEAGEQRLCLLAHMCHPNRLQSWHKFKEKMIKKFQMTATVLNCDCAWHLPCSWPL
jgi:hypothetical protein